MTRKRYSDINAEQHEPKNKKTFLQELKEDLGPAYDRKAQRFKNYVKENPKRTLAYMFSFVVINICMLFFFTQQYKTRSFHYSDLQIKHDSTSVFDQSPDIPFTFDNYSKMNAIKDTLEYLMNKQPLSAGDTLIFLRIAGEIEKLDPDFIKKIKQLPK